MPGLLGSSPEKRKERKGRREGRNRCTTLGMWLWLLLSLLSEEMLQMRDPGTRQMQLGRSRFWHQAQRICLGSASPCSRPLLFVHPPCLGEAFQSHFAPRFMDGQSSLHV